MTEAMRSDPATDGAWEADLGGYRVVFGGNALDQLGEVTRRVGGKRVLVVTDAGIRDASVYLP